MNYLIKNSKIVNEGKIEEQDILIEEGIITAIGKNIQEKTGVSVIDASGKYLLPGVIDDQVHFRDPGLTHKADLFTESRAAVAGGVTSFMEMPNTKPAALTQELLEDKYQIAAQKSLANYSFFMGVSNDNLEEVLKTDPHTVCGIKIFMGSSTGNMLVDDKQVLETIFEKTPMLIAVHCEDEATVKANEALYRQQYGEDVPFRYHPDIRSREACYKSSSMACELAKKYNTRLHILHISTAEEIELFRNDIPLKEKRITSEVCVHHLWFGREDYERLGSGIKCNPAIKEKADGAALLQAMLDDKLDIIATDHAPHTKEEKAGTYFNAPSGLPLIQHTLNLMLEYYHQGKISLERIVEKMAHNPAICFQLAKRGFIREGYYADLVLVDLHSPWTVKPENILYKCGWSPFEGYTFQSKVSHTFVNGHLAYKDGVLNDSVLGRRLSFDRK
jgi:dihydroorotase